MTSLTRSKRTLTISIFYFNTHTTVTRNAVAVIEEFWRKNPTKKRVSLKPKPKATPQKPRKSVARDNSSEVGSTSVKKRGRKSVTNVDSENGMDVDEVRPPKKARKNTANVKQPKSDESDGEGRIVQNMDHYMDKPSWETLVKNVDTVERVGETLMVFFTLYVSLCFSGSFCLLNIF